MKVKRFWGMLLVCVVALNCICPSARASQAPDGNIVRLEDMAWDWVDLSAVEYIQTNDVSRTINSINCSVPNRSIGIVIQNVELSARSTVTFNCSYSPSSASMDFGVLDTNGRFYYTNVKGGSINQAIKISQAGSYAVAVRNNSSQTVRVVGFVEY